MEWETIKMEKMREQPSRLEVIGAVLTVGVLGFWFGVGAALGIKDDKQSGRAYKQIIKWQKNKKNHKAKPRKHNK